MESGIKLPHLYVELRALIDHQGAGSVPNWTE
jgi:hypothetical protein